MKPSAIEKMYYVLNFDTTVVLKYFTIPWQKSPWNIKWDNFLLFLLATCRQCWYRKRTQTNRFVIMFISVQPWVENLVDLLKKKKDSVLLIQVHILCVFLTHFEKVSILKNFLLCIHNVKYVDIYSLATLAWLSTSVNRVYQVSAIFIFYFCPSWPGQLEFEPIWASPHVVQTSQ